MSNIICLLLNLDDSTNTLGGMLIFTCIKGIHVRFKWYPLNSCILKVDDLFLYFYCSFFQKKRKYLSHCQSGKECYR